MVIQKSWRRIGHELLRDRLFQLGLAARLVAIMLIVPWLQTRWFVPFLETTIAQPSVNPWAMFLASGGAVQSFPYGPVMYLAHTTTTLPGIALDIATGSSWFGAFGFRLSLVLADVTLLFLLCRLFNGPASRIVKFYWISPIVLYVLYWHGQTDIVPVTLLWAALLLISERRIVVAGISLGLAVAAKLSMAISAPFLALYLWNNRRQQTGALKRFIGGFVAAVAIAQGLLFLSPPVRHMILESPVMAKVYDLSIIGANGAQIYLVPALYLVFLYATMRIGRMNLRLLFAVIGASFFIVLLLTSAPPGWYLWVVPSIIAYQDDSESVISHLFVWGFGCLFVIVNVMTNSGATIPLLDIDLTIPLVETLSWSKIDFIESLLLTTLFATGLALSASMLRRGITENDFFHFSRRPMAIAIAGDSGSGKDTLARTLGGLFGRNSVVAVSGDDYHLYERGHGQWQTLTHLDPRGNELTGLTRDCVRLISGKPVLARSYNHETGRFTPRRKVRSNDVIIVSGLHALLPQALREAADICIYLDIDENLRRYLKILRDATERGHNREAVIQQLNQRAPDSELYIKPQRDFADIVFSLQPDLPKQLTDKLAPERLKLRLAVEVEDALHHLDLARLVNSLCDSEVDIEPSADHKRIVMTFWPDEITPADIEAAAFQLAPHLDELLPFSPNWRGGTLGIMQLVILVEFAFTVSQRRQS